MSAASITCYERDASSTSRRSAGYGLTLSYATNGALDSLGILEECALKDCRSKSHYVFDKEGRVLKYYGNALKNKGSRKTGQRGNLRVPRSKLREMLLERIERVCEEKGVLVKDVIKWGKEVVALEPCRLRKEEGGGGGKGGGHQDFKVKAAFKDGTETPQSDLLVAADGINSRVVSLLPTLYGRPLPAPAAERLDYFLAIGRSTCDHPLVRGRAFHTLGGVEGRLFLMPYAEGEVMWQLSFPLPAAEGDQLRNGDILGR